MRNVRSESKPHRRLVVTSPDGATGWSTPRLDAALLEPICMASIVRFSARPDADKNRILFANPHNLSPRPSRSEAPGQARERRNLSVKLSYDEGQTWPVNKVLEEGPSAYSDMTVLPDGTVLCFYERQRQLTLARFNLEWLTEGKDALSGSQPAEAKAVKPATSPTIPTLDLGHPATLLMPDGKTIYAVWTYGHGGACGPMKRSDDGGLTCSDLLPTPQNWTNECETVIAAARDTAGKAGKASSEILAAINQAAQRFSENKREKFDGEGEW